MTFDSHVYDRNTSRHYAAYRPPLHEQIIDTALPKGEFKDGLDIGCGTGRSTLALADHCTRTIGVDNSLAMIKEATPHPGVEYRLGSGDLLPVPDNSTDVVTLAGVLPYLNFENTVAELLRVCRTRAYILTYDFEVSMQELTTLFGLSDTPGKTAYDHTRNFSGVPDFHAWDQVSNLVDLNINNHQAAHLLLSSHRRYEEFEVKFQSPDPYDDVLNQLEAMNWGKVLPVKTYYTLHQKR